MSPAEFEYLIKKTLTYLEFHSDDSAKELSAQWAKILKDIQAIKKKNPSKTATPKKLSPPPPAKLRNEEEAN